MKAFIAREKEIILNDVPIPTYSSDECLVRIHYVGINRADLLQVQGLYPPPQGASDILGLEFSGIIEKIGEAVHGFSIGDKVCTIVASGAYAEFVSVHANHLIKLPENIDLKQAAAIPEAFITSYQSLIQIGKLTDSDRLLIHAGASGVGSAAIQLAKKVGAYVICTASIGKHDYCYNLGADACINYKKVEFDQVLSNVDLVLDLIGGSYFQKNINVLAVDGRMVMLGFLGGVKANETNIAGIVAKRLSIQGSTLRARSKDYKSSLIKGFLGQFCRGDDFPFETNVDQVFDFEEVEAAHDYMRNNKNKGKILLKVG